jgi:ATP-binding cassette subfamily B protein
VARGPYRDAGLVIADEPSAALDAKAEHRVFATLRRLHASDHDSDHRDRITVLITHRLANIRGVNHIAVLDDARLTDQGTHDELMTRPSTYTELFSLQASSYAAEIAL